MDNKKTKSKINIGNEKWRQFSRDMIQSSQKLIDDTELFILSSRNNDPLPVAREYLRSVSNKTARKYMRAVRKVVARLHEHMWNLNKEIVSLNNIHLLLCKAFARITQDITINECNWRDRRNKPRLESNLDGADNLLQEELCCLKDSRCIVIRELDRLENHLQVLGCIRTNLKAVIQERSMVLDLDNYSTGKTFLHNPASSASALINEPDPLGPYTTDVDTVVHELQTAMTISHSLRKEITEIYERMSCLKKEFQITTDKGLSQKNGEAMTLLSSLSTQKGSNNVATRRTNKWLGKMQLSQDNTLGPIATHDILSKERVNRPLVRVYQRHPGTQLPEAMELIKNCGKLTNSIEKLKIKKEEHLAMNKKLSENINDKQVASLVDNDILRLRRRCYNNRWQIGVDY